LVDHQLQARVPNEQVDAMRAALVALAEINSDNFATGSGLPRRAA